MRFSQSYKPLGVAPETVLDISMAITLVALA
jgi:hypothetical protein